MIKLWSVFKKVNEVKSTKSYGFTRFNRQVNPRNLSKLRVKTSKTVHCKFIWVLFYIHWVFSSGFLSIFKPDFEPTGIQTTNSITDINLYVLKETQQYGSVVSVLVEFPQYPLLHSQRATHTVIRPEWLHSKGVKYWCFIKTTRRCFLF